MISKEHRFHGHNSLNYVYKTGKSVRSEFISLRCANSRREDYRLAVVVSKKVHKSAVVRNRIRRRIYEIIRLYKQEQNKNWKFDMIITVFDERIATIASEELTSTIRKILKKADL